MMQKPDVEHIDGLSPAISIEQKTTSPATRARPSPRSPKSTITCACCGPASACLTRPRPASRSAPRPSARWSTAPCSCPRAAAITCSPRSSAAARANTAASSPNGRRPASPASASTAQFYAIEEAPALDKKYKHDIEVVVDRIVIREGIEPRLADSFEQALKLAEGLAYLDPADPPEDPPRSRAHRGRRGARRKPPSATSSPPTRPRAASPSPRSSPAPSPASPSPRSSRGCSASTRRRAPARPATASARSWCSTRTSSSPTTTSRSARARSSPGPSPTRPRLITCRCWAQPRPRLRFRARRPVAGPARGSAQRDPPRHRRPPGHPALRRRPPQLRGQEAVRGRHRQPQPPHAPDRIRVDARGAVALPVLAPVRSLPRRPPQARGARVKIAGEDISHVQPPQRRRRLGLVRRAPREAHRDPERDRPRHPQGDQRAPRLPPQCRARLPPPRPHQRHAAAAARASASASPSQIGSGLSGVLYVLDEPSIGLHQKDNDRLLETLKRLRGLGNTVLVVEHDEEAIRTADHVIDMGPGAGVHGGEVVCEGTLDDLLACKGSLTADYLSGRREIPMRETRRKGSGKAITVTGARANNLQGITAAFPLATFTCVTGVSGSGKSSLVVDTLYPAAARALNAARILAGPHDKVTGLEQLDKVIDIDQSPIGRTPRSNPATYTGAFTMIRDWFAGLPESKARGYKPGRFSLQRQGRAVRGVPGRRPDQDRDALPARRLRHLRRVPRRALQPRDARGEVQGPLDRRRARHERRGGRRAVQGGPRDPRQDAHAAGGRARLHQGRPARDDAQRRRGPARQAVARSCRGAPPARPSTSSTSRPPASTSRTSASCSKCSTRWSSRATPWS